MKNIPIYCVAMLLVLAGACQAQEKAPNPDANSAEASEVPQCPYSVVEGDNVYFQVAGYHVVDPGKLNLNLQPYFYVRKAGTATKVCSTWSTNGNQHEEAVASPSNYQIHFKESDADEYEIDIYSDWGNQIVAKGTKKISIKNQIAGAKNPKSGELYPLTISEGNTISSEGNTISLKYVTDEKGCWYFNIVAYQIGCIDQSYLDYMAKNYKSRLSITSGGKQLLDYKFDSGKMEIKPEELKAKSSKGNEILLRYTSKESKEKTAFKVSTDLGTLINIEIPNSEIFEKLAEKMKEFPNDHTEWIVSVGDSGNEVSLSFAGIRRFYKAVNFNLENWAEVHDRARYAEKGYLPWIRLYVYCLDDGQNCEVNGYYAESSMDGWSAGFLKNKYNQFEIREGIGKTYSIRLQDANTWFTEIHLGNIKNGPQNKNEKMKVGLKDRAFREPIEKFRPSITTPDVILNFEEIKQ